MAAFDTSLSAPPLDIGLSGGGGGYVGPDLSTLLNDLNLAPQPLTYGPPPVDISTLPTVSPIDTGILGLPPPPQLPPLPPPDLTGILPPVGLPPIGYDANGNPIYSVTGTLPAPYVPPLPPPPQPITQPPPITVTTQGAGGSVTVNVTVQNAENIANDVIQRLQQAITQGITDSVQAASDVAKSVFGQIADALRNVFSKIWDTLKNVLQAIAGEIGQIVAGIGDALKNAAEFIFKGIATIFTDLRKVLVDVINKIGPVLDNISRHIQKINDTLIAPIANFINTTVRTIAALTVAIEKDLHDGLAGIVRIPGDIASGITSIDASLNRTVQQLGQYNGDLVNSTFRSLSGSPVGESLYGLTNAVSGTFNADVTNTTFQVTDQLTEACDLPSINKAIADQFGEIKPQSGLWKDLYNMIRGLFLELSQITAYFEKMNESAEEQVNRRCPLKKVDIASLVQAVLRKFLTPGQMDEEMALQGYSASRSKLYRDLSVYVETTQDLIDYWFRGIITDDDLVRGLRALGFTEAQIAAYKEGSTKLLDPQTAITGWQRAVLDETEVNKTLNANRYDNAQITLLKTLAYRPPNTDEALAGTHNRAFLGQVFSSLSDWDAIPEWYSVAGRAQGFDENTIRLSWWIHFFTGDIQTWIILYFRGIRTYTELQAFMDSRGVPREFQNDLIEVNRPLIQYRSIPAYVRAGILSDARARSILAAHGFSLEDINAIMEAATHQGKSVKAAAASSIQTLSIANAKTLFNDGVFDQSQYEAILEQHGYTPQLANAQAQVDAINAHARHRKQTLSDYAAQVEAGVLTLDDAIGKLQAQGFTVAEIQTWQARVIHTLKIGQKHPSLSELHAFLKANLITLDDYRSELQLQGWGDPWLSAFVALVTPT